MKMPYIVLVIFLFLGITSCSMNDDELLDVEQINQVASDSNDPPLEETGEEEELEPNGN